jgi:hypothetical protein
MMLDKGHEMIMATTTPSNGKRRGMLAGIWEFQLKIWTWKVGPEAAAHYVAKNRWWFRGSALGMATMILFVVMYHIAFIPHWVSLTVFYTLMVVGFCCVILMYRELHRYWLAASKALGIPTLTWRITKKMIAQGHIPEPPRHRDHYLAWCAKYGQKPYPFKPPDDSSPSNPPVHPAGTPRNTQQQGDGSWGIPDGGWGIPEHPTDRPQTNP